MTVKSSISLTDEQAAFARSLVDEGRYGTLSAVIQQGLELLRRTMEADQIELERKAAETEMLRHLLKKRAEGPFISEEEFRKRTDAMLERKRREYGV